MKDNRKIVSLDILLESPHLKWINQLVWERDKASTLSASPIPSCRNGGGTPGHAEGAASPVCHTCLLAFADTATCDRVAPPSSDACKSRLFPETLLWEDAPSFSGFPPPYPVVMMLHSLVPAPWHLGLHYSRAWTPS
jgi:hypothetical protein